MLEIRIHGYGGQGAVTLAHLLAQAALDSGSQSQALPSFGVERRGAPVKADVRIDNTPILVHSQSTTPNILAFMDKLLIDTGVAEGCAENCILVVNAAEPHATDKEAYFLDAMGMAADEDLTAGGTPLLNIPLLGALACIAEIPAEVLDETLRKKWSGEAGEKNVRAARRGYDSVAKQKGELA